MNFFKGRTRFVFKAFQLSFMLAAVSANEASQASSADKITVLVIDQGIDFESSNLKNVKHSIISEAGGHPNLDDNQDGFSDNISGWNQISNDPYFFPDYILESFTENLQQTKTDLEIYSGIEKRDLSSIQKFHSDKDLQKRIGKLLEYAHGTHVAGVIAQESQNAGLMHSLNIMDGSLKESGSQTVDLAVNMDAAQKMNPKEILEIMQDPRPKESQESLFDDKETLKKIAERRAASTTHFVNQIDKYLKGVSPRVVNMSFGMSFLQVVEQLLQVWNLELKDRNLPENTEMSPLQRTHLVWLAQTIFTHAKKEWTRVLLQNPRILFIAAAGNEGQDNETELGNLDIYDAVPASLAEFLPNLVTVVATGPENKIADFSSHSKKRTTLGAPGVAIPSNAPAGLSVAMSGTSMAAPYVTGLATKTFEINPKLLPAQVKSLMSRAVMLSPSLKEKTASGGVIHKETLLRWAQRTKTESFEKVILNAKPVDSVFGRSEKILILNPFDHERSLEDTSAFETPDLVKKMLKNLGRAFSLR
jgi:subtilisin family serine protease